MEPWVVAWPDYSAFLMRIEHWELWRGLPEDRQFLRIRTRNGMSALCWEDAGRYIYVPPDATQALAKDRKVFLAALVSRARGMIVAPWLVPKTGSEQVLQVHLETLNQEILNPYLSRG
jgi:hypothetical protein